MQFYMQRFDIKKSFLHRCFYCDLINNAKKFKFNTSNLHNIKNRIRKNRIHTIYVLATIDGRFPSQKYG